MVTSGMAQSGPVTSVWGIAQYNMVDMAYRQAGFSRRNAAERFKALRRSSSGVSGAVEMVQSVLMIGGGEASCARADHGIGITETGGASFVDYAEIR